MAANKPDPQRLISVQSHVVTGYVGNRSATFPLQLLGYEVDTVHTTQLSNHTGYGRFGGMRLDAAHLQSVFEGMEKNGLLRYGRILSGYTPSPTALSVVSGFVKKMRSYNPELVYLLDPVMGDMGRGYYVDKECLPLYQELMSSATIICPNQFEAQQLAGQEINSLQTLKEVIKKLHSLGTPNVIITSVVSLPTEDIEKIGAKVNGGMILVGSSADPSNPNQNQPWCIQFPELEDYFVGVGDLFSALMLGFFRNEHKNSSLKTASENAINTPLAIAAELAVAGVQGVLHRTLEFIEQEQIPDNYEQLDEVEKRVAKARKVELRLVASRNEIENPKIKFHAKSLP